MFQKRLNLIVPKFLFVFIVLVIHNKTPVDRLNSCLIIDFLFSFEFLVGKEVTGHHFPFFVGAEKEVQEICETWVLLEIGPVTCYAFFVLTGATYQ